jgi:hypothetical protein
MWVLRCCLHGLTFVHVLPVIMFGAMAALLLADERLAFTHIFRHIS